MSAEPIREATDAELDAKMLRELRGYAMAGSRHQGCMVTWEEFDLLLRIADERDHLRRAFCEEPERPNPYASGKSLSSNYVVTRCAHCPHAPHGAGYICHESQTCGCRGGLS